jgi:hypothetical protein
MDGACSRYGKKRNACTILLGKREGKRTIGVGWKIILKWVLMAVVQKISNNVRFT